MDELAGAGADVPPEDLDPERESEGEGGIAPDDDSRTLDDALDEEDPGIDAERRVDLGDERRGGGTDAAAAETEE
ncbi:hypothetical protein [Agromyces archimandritae]|uniref:Uncharacterized protein n=1 Tax=Agromyces archimandritae TaxID=2781962 RepID=A0A975INZ2_9MICO|nr:hypothetical protein [Agromyces archimandritae]QTX05092.1 hypothetical protein G127AT_02305 [Agromyces archimandritae]